MAVKMGDLNAVLLQEVQQVDDRRSSSCGKRAWRYVLGASCAISGVAAATLRYATNATSPVTTTICSVATGIGLQACFDICAPRRIVRKVHQFQMHYAIPAFLGLWNLYLNLNDPSDQEKVITALGAMAGASLVVKTSTIACQRMIDLKVSRYEVGATPHLNVIGQSFDVRYSTAFKAALGGGLMIASSVGALGSQAIKIGAIITGHAIGGIAQKIFRAKLGDHKVGRLVSRLSYVLDKNLWGGLVVLRHWSSWGVIGGLIGSAHSAELDEFQRIERAKEAPAPMPQNQQIALRALNGVLLAGSHAFIIDQMATEQGGVTGIVSLASSLVGAYAGYGLTTWANNHFNPQENRPIANTVEFYAKWHTDWLPLIFLYMTSEIDIDDEALKKLVFFSKSLAAGAWLSLGLAVGNDQGRPYGERESFPATFDANVGRLLFGLATGKI